MKTKTIVLLEIAIVLCSVLLVTSTTAASEIYEPGPLDVFGNANEDDTIDMRDTTCIKLVIFGKKPKTDLADANYDGKISMLDVGQTKLIILGKDKKLTFIDIFGEAETVTKPIKRLVNLGYYGAHVTRAVGASDILVAVGSKQSKILFPEISKLPTVGGSPPSVDYEMVLSLKPDVVVTNDNSRTTAKIENKEELKRKLPGIPLVCLNIREPGGFGKNVRTFGYIIDREDEAKEFASWYEGYYNMFEARTEGLSEDEKRQVFCGNVDPYRCWVPGGRFDQALTLVGAKNIVWELEMPPGVPPHSGIEVEAEWVMEKNPEFIFGALWSGVAGYDTDDPSEAEAELQRILNRPELAKVDAVMTKNVHLIYGGLPGGAGQQVIAMAYWGKTLHPDLFGDIDPQAIHQEYVDKFCHIVFDVRNHGVFIYPPLE